MIAKELFDARRRPVGLGRGQNVLRIAEAGRMGRIGEDGDSHAESLCLGPDARTRETALSTIDPIRSP